VSGVEQSASVVAGDDARHQRRRHTLVEERGDIGVERPLRLLRRRLGADGCRPAIRSLLPVRIVKQRATSAASEIVGTTMVRFCDRSPICTPALADYLGQPVPDALIAEIDRIGRTRACERRVFLVRDLGFDERTDARRISFDESSG
jgi:predicted ATPase